MADTDDQTPDAELEGTEDTAGKAGDGSSEEEEEPFDKARAQAKINKVNREAQSLRDRLKLAEEKAAKLDAIEREKLSKEDKLAAELADSQKAFEELKSELLRAKVQAKRPDITDAQVKRLVGTSVEELLEDAQELFGDYTPPRKTVTKSVTPKEDEVEGGNKPGAGANPSLAQQIFEAEKAKDFNLARQLKTRQLFTPSAK
jgi:hypothetical protein